MISITGQKYKQMLVAGANKLEEAKQMVNDMNVFPVPDGDTGTNMSLTVTSAVKEVLAVASSSVTDISKALSSGALRGARGNSGVILSQLFRGLYKGVNGETELTAKSLAAGMEKGVATAYKAVMKPKEGTILTVAKAAADKAVEMAQTEEDLIVIMEAVVAQAKETLDQTPEMLPVLKEAGVVDSGGEGLLLIYQGYLEALKRDDEDVDPIMALSENKDAKKAVKAAYCVEVTLETEEVAKKMPSVKENLEKLGEKIKAGVSGRSMNLHIHTEDPGKVLSLLCEVGAMIFTKVENMAVNHKHVLTIEEPKKKEPMKDIGFIAVAAGDGLKNIFTELGVDYVISGGQTMNPSTEDVLKAAEVVNAKDIVVLPNNKNIVLAAEQAASIIKDKGLHVIPTRSIPQGISAMIGFMPGESVEANMENMKESVSMVVSGSVTYAVRNTKIDGIEISEGDILAMKDEKICCVGKDLVDTTVELAQNMATDETGIITIYYGADCKEEQAEELRNKIAEAIPGIEVEVQLGGQPVYYFLLSAE